MAEEKQNPILRYAVVKENNDPSGRGRIKISSPTSDMQGTTLDKEAWLLPALPQVFSVTPKVGELVEVIVPDGDDDTPIKYYIGPVIPDKNMMEMAPDTEAGKRLLDKDTDTSTKQSSEIVPEQFGCFANKEDIAIYGRRNAEVFLGDDYATMRCGARVPNYTAKNPDGNGYKFDNEEASFLLLKGGDNESTATIVANDINLIPNAIGPVDPQNKENNPAMIDEDKLQSLIDKAHVLPYGDILVDFLKQFVDVFLNHYHVYPGLPPDAKSKEIIDLTDRKAQLEKEMLSEHVRIN